MDGWGSIDANLVFFAIVVVGEAFVLRHTIRALLAGTIVNIPVAAYAVVATYEFFARRMGMAVVQSRILAL